MKKRIALTTLVTGVAFGATAQGSLGNIQNTFVNYGILAPPALPYSGNATITLYYLETATQAQINAINALNETSSTYPPELNLLNSDGFTEVSTTSGFTAGPVSGYSVENGLFAAGPDTISLLSPVPTDGSGALVMVVTAVGGPYAGDEGVVAWFQPNLGAPGNPANIVSDPDDRYLNLAATPEPGTLALAAFGSTSLVLFRFRKH